MPPAVYWHISVRIQLEQGSLTEGFSASITAGCASAGGAPGETTADQSAGQLRSRKTNPVSHGSMCIPSCPAGRLFPPQTPFNPHTSTALAGQLNAFASRMSPCRIASSSNPPKPSSNAFGSGRLRVHRSTARTSIPWAAANSSARREVIPFLRYPIV
jgi:hypothetical protein